VVHAVKAIYQVQSTIIFGNQRRQNQMQWLINKQVAVEAETPEEAVAKINEGKTISFSVTQRPLPPPTGSPGMIQGSSMIPFSSTATGRTP
jgi:hypothetical protein